MISQIVFKVKLKEKINLRKENIKRVYSANLPYIITIFSGFIISFIMFYFTNLEQIRWNMGINYTIFLIVIQILISILFGINMTMLWEKLHFSAKIDSNEAGSVSLATILSVIVSGCPACGITIASYLGLASVLSSLPLYGLELKIAGLILLLYSTDSLVKDMHTCKINFKKKKN